MTLSRPHLQEISEPLWFCLKAQPKREHFAAAALRQTMSLEVLAPRIRFRKVTRRGPVWFEEAMFPGYLFARFQYMTQYRQVQSSTAVTQIVHFGDCVGVLEVAAIEQLRQAAGDQGVVVFAPELQVGDSVRIAEGAFQGLDAIITQLLPARERVKVLLDFLGRSIEAEVALPAILPSAAPRSTIAQN